LVALHWVLPQNGPRPVSR